MLNAIKTHTNSTTNAQEILQNTNSTMKYTKSKAESENTNRTIQDKNYNARTHHLSLFQFRTIRLRIQFELSKKRILHFSLNILHSLIFFVAFLHFFFFCITVNIPSTAFITIDDQITLDFTVSKE